MRRLLTAALACLALAFIAAGVFEAREQRRQDEYVRAVTRDVLAGVPDEYYAKVSALRDYIRAHVRNVEFAGLTRPFLRDTAADTLRTGKGRCGEATRVFVNMARAAGIPSQRLYLEGEKSHVVAVLVRDDYDDPLIVDSSGDPTYFKELEPLSTLKSHTEFRTFSTWRRIRNLNAFPSNFVSIGPLAYLFENPHALVACLCFIASAAAFALALYVARRLTHATERGFHTTVAFEGEGAL